MHIDSSSAQLPDTKLVLKATESNELGLNSELLDSNTVNKISGVWGEINKEVKIESIGSKVSSSYEKLRDQHLTSASETQKQHLSEFKNTKVQVDQWSKSRNKVSSAKALTQSQRTTLQKIYELHDALQNESNNLKEELKKYGDLQELQSLAQKSGTPSAKDIKSALSTIDWLGEKVKVQKNLADTKFFSTKDWGAWKVNPYRLFYDDERRWRTDISSSNKNASTVHKLEQTIARLNSMVLISWGQRTKRHLRDEQEKLDKAKSNMHSHIELQIAYKLLRYMNAPKT